MKNLIKRYINNLNINQIKDFAFQNNISLNNKEFEFVYSLIKNNYEKILYDPDFVLDQVKANINSLESQKIINLYFYYRSKYQHLL